jgi:hypothetical protein
MIVYSRALALLLCSAVVVSATTPERFRPSYRARDAKIEAILSALGPELERDFQAGPPFSLTVLRGMAAANRLGPEGRDASRIWRDEINKHYRAHRSGTRLALGREVARLDGTSLDDVLALVLPESRNPQWHGTLNTGLVRYTVGDTQSVRRARIAAVCESLQSTPLRWSARYPQRQAFTFSRFGIDWAVLVRWCGVRRAR